MSMDVRSPEVSVIIPVNGEEPFMERFVSFLDNQTFKDFEILFVINPDDPDISTSKAERLFAERDNVGVVYRNDMCGDNIDTGFYGVHGRLVWFTDTECLLSPDFLNEMVSLQKGTSSDIVCCNFAYAGPKDRVMKDFAREVSKITVMNNEEAMYAMVTGQFPSTIWSKLFVRDFLVRNDLRFGCSVSENVCSMYMSVICAEKVTYYSRAMYGYREYLGWIDRSGAIRDVRGRGKIEAYDTVDFMFSDHPGLGSIVSKRLAIMRIEASVQMTYRSYMSYAKSTGFKEVYDRELRSPPSLKGAVHRYMPTLYFAITYVPRRFFSHRAGYTFSRPGRILKFGKEKTK